MAPFTGALTLTQLALTTREPLVQAVTYSLIMNGNAMQDIPFVDRATLYANGLRFEGNLPTVNWANLNDPGTATSGTPTPFQEQSYIIRNLIDIDHIFVEDQNQIVDPRATQVGAYLKAVTYDFNDKFINNNHTSGDTKSFVGVRYRIDNGTQWGVRSENKINANGVDLSSSGLTAATGNAFLELLDQLLWSVDSPDGTGVVLWLNDLLYRRLNTVFRQLAGSGGFSTAQDQFGRTLTRYRNATIRDIGYKADQSTRIITATETSAGNNGSSTYTSIYATNLGTEHMFGWQFAPLAARDLGLMNDGVIYRTFLEWVGGLYNASTRSMGRMYGIKIA
jgi:hypothetical protein